MTDTHSADDAIQKHDRICALPTPSNAQRSFISEYMASNDLNGRRGAFFSAELRGEQPSAYRERWLEDLTVFEHGPEMHDAFGRWVVMPVLKAAHFLYLGRRKVSSELSRVYPLMGLSDPVQFF